MPCRGRGRSTRWRGRTSHRRRGRHGSPRSSRTHSRCTRRARSKAAEASARSRQWNRTRPPHSEPQRPRRRKTFRSAHHSSRAHTCSHPRCSCRGHCTPRRDRRSWRCTRVRSSHRRIRSRSRCTDRARCTMPSGRRWRRRRSRRATRGSTCTRHFHRARKSRGQSTWPRRRTATLSRTCPSMRDGSRSLGWSSGRGRCSRFVPRSRHHRRRVKRCTCGRCSQRRTRTRW